MPVLELPPFEFQVHPALSFARTIPLARHEVRPEFNEQLLPTPSMSNPPDASQQPPLFRFVCDSHVM